jgi:ATP-binding cassette, subfamily B, bacterial HlyB/CyaB
MNDVGSGPVSKIDSGLQSLSLLLRFHGIAIDSAQISHRAGGVAIGVTEMLQCAREIKLKARVITTNWLQLGKLALPAIVERE